MAYMKTRVVGFEKEGGDWDCLRNVLCALGVALDTTKGSGHGSLLLVRPSADDDLDYVATGLADWLGLIPGQVETCRQKLTQATANARFCRRDFSLLLQRLSSEACVDSFTIGQ